MGNSRNKALTLAKINSSSMSPLIIKGEKVLLKKTLKLKRGDLIGFKPENRGGISLIHRLIKVAGKRLVTCGDNSRKFDGIVDYKNVLGKVEMIKMGTKWKQINALFIIPYISYLQSLLIQLSVKHPKVKVFHGLKKVTSILLRKLVYTFG